jgi:putative hydrolase of the HAD superfamily
VGGYPTSRLTECEREYKSRLKERQGGRFPRTATTLCRPVTSGFSYNGASVRCIFFDAAGTLIYLPRGVGFHYASVARRHGAQLDEAELTRVFYLVWKTMPARLAVNGARPDDDKGWWRLLVERVLDRFPPSNLQRDAYFEELYLEFAKPGVWALFPEVVDVLDSLRGQCELGIISNFDGRLRPILEQLGILHYFRELIISSEIGADKPDRRLFEAALKRFAVAPSEALHVGDDPIADWKAAESAGMQVFQLDRQVNDLRGLPL